MRLLLFSQSSAWFLCATAVFANPAEQPTPGVLLAEQFVRIHRNALVALAYLQGIERAGIGAYRVRLQGIEEGPQISRRHLPALRARLNGKP